jgi:hypothetical protein
MGGLQMTDPIQSTLDLVWFSFGGLLGLLLAWRPRKTLGVIFGRRTVAKAPDWVVRFDRIAGAIAAFGALWMLAVHFFVKST